MTMPQQFIQIREFIHRHKTWEPLVLFVSGFTFDAFLLHRIDDPLMLVHQAVYLSMAAFIIAWDLFCEAGKAAPPKWLAKAWNFREGGLHFLLGTLLNVYTIFYFKSGTLLNSAVFLLLLAALLYVNEVRPTKLPKHALRNSLFGLCLVSYLNILVSILVGSVGQLVFLLSILVSAAIMYGFVHLLSKRLPPEKVSREIRLPMMGVLVVYLLLYFFRVLPPVPLSVKHMGIYREVQKVDGGYRLGYSRPSWKFWESGDQTFIARTGDKIYCFVQVFSPTRFQDQLFVRWQFDDPKNGWTGQDAIPFSVLGGRDQGFRGFTVKSNYLPGDWRILLETSDGREIGRLTFTIAESTDNGNSGAGIEPLKYELR